MTTLWVGQYEARIPARARVFIFSKFPDPFSRLFHAYRGSIPAVIRPGLEANNLPPYKAAVKNCWGCTCIGIILTFWHRSLTFNSNKSPTWCNSFSVYYPDVCLQLNMFRAFSRPSSGAQWLQWQPLVLPSYRGDSRAVFVVGPAGQPTSPTTNTTWLSPWYEGKTRGCHCSHWAPDDGQENARNMFSCKQTSG